MIMRKLLIPFAALLLVTGCYDNYVRDFDYDAVFAAYQYDLRTFVLGEEAKFDWTVALAGVMANDRDRTVEVALDETLLTGAVAGMKSQSLVSGDYVSAAFKTFAGADLTPLPATHFTVSGIEGLTIRKGRYTASVTLRATEAMAADPLAFQPGYGVAFRILKADADTVLETKNYAVIGVICENRFYGNWTRQGETSVYDAGGNLVSTDTEAASLADERVYNLTTVDANTLRCNKVDGSSGEMLLSFNGDNITVSSTDGSVSGTGSFNGAELLQDRKLTLNYTVTTATGRKEVKDLLSFRNRIRDGVNEWQDENPAHYN